MLTDLQIKRWLKIRIPWNYKTDVLNEKSQSQGVDPGTTEYKHHTMWCVAMYNFKLKGDLPYKGLYIFR